MRYISNNNKFVIIFYISSVELIKYVPTSSQILETLKRNLKYLEKPYKFFLNELEDRLRVAALKARHVDSG